MRRVSIHNFCLLSASDMDSVTGAVLQNAVALHIAIGHTGAPSVSTQIGALRNLFSGHGKGELGAAFEKIRSGALRLVIHVNSADIIASLLRLKEEVERDGDADIKLVLVGAAEAHLIAGEIGKHGVGVVLVPARPYPASWESRRILPGIPLTEKNAFTTLRDANVTVGLGCVYHAFPSGAGNCLLIL